MENIKPLFSFIVAMAVAFAATPLVKAIAVRIGAVDVPRDNRRMHDHPIPLIGGLAIFAGFLAGSLIFTRYGRINWFILLGAVVILALGVVDDIKAMKPIPKLIGQICAAILPVLAGVRINVMFNPFSSVGYSNLGTWGVLVTVIWIVGIINAVNFIDGLDGLAAGVSAISAIIMLVIAVVGRQWHLVIFLAALAGACVGFLPFNFNPAKIFMGDTGSQFLGYMLAVLSVQGMFKFYALISFAIPFLILGLPIFDAAFAIIRRTIKGQNPMKADKDHFHHKLISMGFNQKQAVTILYIFSLGLGLCAVVLTTSRGLKTIILITAILVSMAVSLAITYNEKRRRAREQSRRDGENR